MDVAMLESALADLSERWTAPLSGECLDCYLRRMLDAYGCAGHRFTRRWARGRPRGTEDGLVRWAADRGGCCCDCEVVLNSLRRRRAPVRRGGVLCALAVARQEAEEADVEVLLPPGCSGVR